MQLLLELLDFLAILGAETLKLLLLFQSEHWLLVGILECLLPPLLLLRVQAPLQAVSADLGAVQPSSFEYHRELCLYHFNKRGPSRMPAPHLPASGRVPVVECGHVNCKLC